MYLKVGKGEDLAGHMVLKVETLKAASWRRWKHTTGWGGFFLIPFFFFFVDFLEGQS